MTPEIFSDKCCSDSCLNAAFQFPLKGKEAFFIKKLVTPNTLTTKLAHIMNAHLILVELQTPNISVFFS